MKLYVMKTKVYSILSRAPELKSHYQNPYGIILRTPNFFPEGV